MGLAQDFASRVSLYEPGTLLKTIQSSGERLMELSTLKEALVADGIGAAVAAFPVGAVFISVVATNPATLLGYGTWAAFGAGRVMIGLDAGDTDFDTAEETGGAKTVAAAGTVAAPTISGATATEAAHTHSVTSNVAVTAHATVPMTDTTPTNEAVADGTHSVTNNPVTSAAGSAHSHDVGTLAASAPGFTGSATSVVQPYIVCYFWKRTA